MSIKLFDLSGKNALLTGATHGLGMAIEASDFVNGHILYVDGGILATIGKPRDHQ